MAVGSCSVLAFHLLACLHCHSISMSAFTILVPGFFGSFLFFFHWFWSFVPVCPYLLYQQMQALWRLFHSSSVIFAPACWTPVVFCTWGTSQSVLICGRCNVGTFWFFDTIFFFWLSTVFAVPVVLVLPFFHLFVHVFLVFPFVDKNCASRWKSDGFP